MNAKLIEVLARHWGFASFRPLQAEAMEAALGGNDTLVVMPTGG
jgi:ATP-dependent DNA helicase RecQ